jgi:hypothetical protein
MPTDAGTGLLLCAGVMTTAVLKGLLLKRQQQAPSQADGLHIDLAQQQRRSGAAAALNWLVNEGPSKLLSSRTCGWIVSYRAEHLLL